MATLTLRKKVHIPTGPAEHAGKEARSYIRKVWLAGLGAYSRLGREGLDYLRELIRAGEDVEAEGKQLLDRKLRAANTQIDEVTDELFDAGNRLEHQASRLERAFDARVAGALHRIGIPSRQDVERLSAKLDQLQVLVEYAARKQ